MRLKPTDKKYFKKVVDKLLKKCYNKYIERRTNKNKKIKKVVDKLLKKCYNNNVNKTNNFKKVGIRLWKRRLQEKSILE